MQLCTEQVNKPRTVLAYKFKANADGTIDLVNALRVAGVPCDGCAGWQRCLATCQV